jgi:hypothetical protein
MHHACMIRDTILSCRGIAWANYRDQPAALRAIQALDGALLPSGHQLMVSLQAPLTARGFPLAALHSPFGGSV